MELYLVTGGAGFIGSNIVQRLVSEGKQVRVLDDFSTGKRENIAPYMNKVELVEGDLSDLSVCKAAVSGVKFVLHQGALPSVPRSVRDPIASNTVNVGGTLNMLWAAKEAGVKRFVYASSSSVYGDSKVLPKVETMIPSPLSPYAVSKLTGEYYCRVFFSLYGLETVSLRYFNVFGPRQDPTSQYAAVVPKFATAILAGDSPTIYGDGEQTRDFSYVENVVNANLAGLSAPDCAGGVFNIACNSRITVNELVAVLCRVLKRDVQATYVDSRPGDVKHSLADIEQAKKLLNYEPKVSVEDGIERYCEWLLNSNK